MEDFPIEIREEDDGVWHAKLNVLPKVTSKQSCSLPHKGGCFGAGEALDCLAPFPKQTLSPSANVLVGNPKQWWY